MRSDLVFEAMTRVSGRFLLTKLVSKTTRRLHKPNTRIQDTTNALFVRLTGAYRIARVWRFQQPRTVRFPTQLETEILLHESNVLPAEGNGISL